MVIPSNGGSSTILSTIAGYFYEASAGIKGAGSYLKGIPVIGEGIWVYFYNAGQFLTWIGDRFKDFEGVFNAVKKFTVKLEQESGIIDLVNAVWSEFSSIRSDPVSYVKAKLDKISSVYKAIRDDAVGWVKERVKDADADLAAIINTGSGWIKDKLNIIFPELPKFANDPFGYVKGKLYDNVPFLSPLLTDPKLWVKYRLGDILGVPLSFFDDPWDYVTRRVLDAIEGYFDRYRTQVKRMGENILRRLWEGT